MGFGDLFVLGEPLLKRVGLLEWHCGCAHLIISVQNRWIVLYSGGMRRLINDGGMQMAKERAKEKLKKRVAGQGQQSVTQETFNALSFYGHLKKESLRKGKNHKTEQLHTMKRSVSEILLDPCV